MTSLKNQNLRTEIVDEVDGGGDDGVCGGGDYDEKI
jgi:hypothetical protein